MKGGMSLLWRKARIALHLAANVASSTIGRRFTISDLKSAIAWPSACSQLPSITLVSEDHVDNTSLLEIGDFRFWWPTTASKETLDVVWAEVNLPFPPNAHAYEHAGCTLNAGEWVVDAGCCEGAFTDKALRAGCNVIAVEPVPDLAYCLSKTFETPIRKGRVLLVDQMLGSSQGHAYIDWNVSPIGARESTTPTTVQVKKVTLDQLQKQLSIDHFDFVKIDVEGAEEEILIGAREVLVKQKPRISAAVYHFSVEGALVTRRIRKSNPEYHVLNKGLVRLGGELVAKMVHAF